MELLKLKNKITEKKILNRLAQQQNRKDRGNREVKDRTIPNLNNRERKTN